MTKKNEQQEIIIWHKFPDEKPKENKYYFVTYGGDVFEQQTGHDFYSNDSWTKEYRNVIAWAEMPKGWKED